MQEDQPQIIVINKDGRGRQRKTTSRIYKAIVREAQINPRKFALIITAEIKNEFNLTVNSQTIQNQRSRSAEKSKIHVID